MVTYYLRWITLAQSEGGRIFDAILSMERLRVAKGQSRKLISVNLVLIVLVAAGL